VERYVTTKVTGTEDDMQIGAFKIGGKGGGGKGGGGGQDKSLVRCHWCDKEGHVMKECRSKLAGHAKSQAAIDRQADWKAQRNNQADSQGSHWNSSWTRWKDRSDGEVNGFSADRNWRDEQWQSNGEKGADESPEVGGLALN